MNVSGWMSLAIASLGIFGTLAATLIAQRGESKRRASERDDALKRERREAIRADYREVLRFIAHTRLFVMEMRRRLAELPEYSAHVSSDAREVEDLEARGEMLRRSFLDELPDIRALVEAWGEQTLIDTFDAVSAYGVKIKASTDVYLHLTIKGKRFEGGHEDALQAMDEVLGLLAQARDALKRELTP